MKVDIVGGPLDGTAIDRPRLNRLVIPQHIPSEPGIGQFMYVVRRARTMEGELIEVLTPFGEAIHPEYLAANNLTVEN